MAEDFDTEAWTLMSIALAFILLRIYSRCSFEGVKNLALDDYLMVAAGLVYVAETVEAYLVGQEDGLTNGAMTDAARAALDPSSSEYAMRVAGSKVQLSGWLTMIGLLWLLKLCMLIYYSRLTDGVDKMNNRVRAGYVVLFVSFIATFCCVAFGCYPFRKHWQINPDPGNFCAPAQSKLSAISVIIFDGITDLLLMTLPLPVIWKARLPTKQKLMLVGMFSGGFAIMAFAMMRCIFMLGAGADGPAQVGKWSIRESFVAIIVDNLPMIYPLLKRHFSSIFGSVAATREAYSLSSHQKNSRYGLGSRGMKKSNHMDTDLLETAWGSKERIVDSNDLGLASNATHDTRPSNSTSCNSSNGSGAENSYEGKQVIHIVTELNVESTPATPTGSDNMAGTRYEDDFKKYAEKANFTSPRPTNFTPIHRRGSSANIK